jgi:hypothetical protein
MNISRSLTHLRELLLKLYIFNSIQKCRDTPVQKLQCSPCTAEPLRGRQLLRQGCSVCVRTLISTRTEGSGTPSAISARLFPHTFSFDPGLKYIRRSLLSLSSIMGSYTDRFVHKKMKTHTKNVSFSA